MGDLPSRLLGEFLDVLLPPRCPACAAATSGWPSVFCPPCEDALERAPSPVHMPPGDRVDRLVSPFTYGGPIARAIVLFKHSGQPGLGRRLADLALSCVDLPGTDAVVPVPLHPRRLAGRGFNPAGVIAGRLAPRAASPLLRGGLRRVRDTTSQAGLTPRSRERNVRDAFAVGRRRPRLAGRRVLLVDDVWTTGATARACAGVLLAAGAVSVSVFTLARVA